MATNKILALDTFNFVPGRILSKKYEVIRSLGTGWEGEVYLVKEIGTGIERAAKFFFPHRNIGEKMVRYHAQKLHKLRHCSIVIQYQTQESIVYRGTPVSFLISEYVEGEPLSEFLLRQPGRRLTPFQGLHLLHSLASGIECIHQLREYHGDLHPGNIMLQRYGLGFELKLIDFFHWKNPRRENIQEDVLQMVRVLYDVLGGQKHYTRLPDEIKQICCGLKSSLILKKFRTAGQLRSYLEVMEWKQ